MPVPGTPQSSHYHDRPFSPLHPEPHRLHIAEVAVRRPIAVCMFFVAVVILGIVAVARIPVELIPNLQGEKLYVSFGRTGAEASVLERDILLPLQARATEMSNVVETTASIFGSFGRFVVTLERGTDVKKREFELNRIASSIRSGQPVGTWINVSASNTLAYQAFVLTVHVLAPTEDTNAIRDIANEIIAPRLSSVPGVSQARVSGGASARVNIEVSPQRMVAFGLTSNDVVGAVNRQFGSMSYLGKSESQDGRTNLFLDGRAAGLETVANARVGSGTGAPLLRNVAKIETGPGLRETLFRVNGKPAVGISIFKEQSGNTIEIARLVRERLDTLLAEMRSLGIDLYVSADAGEELEKQLGRLGKLALSGYLVALLALFVFLRQWRAVAVVGLAVPVSVLGAIGALYLLGETLNLITIFGLAIAIGLLVDNSVVVYESILRQMEKGADPMAATRRGIRRTVRAIVAASVTTAVVFLPPFIVDLDSQEMEGVFRLVAISILLPMAASLLVAVGLVPVLAHRMVAPATLSALARNHEIRAERAGLAPPDRAKMLLGGLVAHALRHPPAWITGTAFAIVITVAIGFPLIPTSRAATTKADSVSFEARFGGTERPVEHTVEPMAHIESALLEVDGVESVQTSIASEGASVRVNLVDEAERPDDLSPSRIRSVAEDIADDIPGFDVFQPGESARRGSGGAVHGGGRQRGMFAGSQEEEIELSGPDSSKLMELAEELVYVLSNTEEYVARARLSVSRGNQEIWVEPVIPALESFGITTSDVLPFLELAGRDGVRAGNKYVLPSGRELPVVTEREGARDNTNVIEDLSSLRISTPSGELPADALVSTRKMPAAPVIEHRNGRREMSVFYRLARSVPESGPAREAVDTAIKELVRSVPKDDSYTVQFAKQTEGVSLLSKIMLPLLALMYLVLALVFESFILPPLVMLAIPLTVLGSTWALTFARLPFDSMAGLGAVALVGISVNASILLVDRIQQKVLRAGWSPGSAALAAVKERTRPLLMTTITTIVALWPLAIATGRENEMWPPFATLMIGGMATSAALVLLVIPVCYILLQRLESLFGRVGPWLVLAWAGVVVAVVGPLIHYEILVSVLWRIVCTLLVMGAMLAAVVLLFRRTADVQPRGSDGPPELDVRNLKKVYDQPGSVRRAFNAPREYARRVSELGGKVYSPRTALERITVLLIVAAGLAFIGYSASTTFWSLVFWLLSSVAFRAILLEIRKSRGLVTAAGQVVRGGVEGVLRVSAPWVPMAAFAYLHMVGPSIAGESWSTGSFWTAVFAAILLTSQLLRRTALRVGAGVLEDRVARGALRRVRTLWRNLSNKAFGFDLPKQPVAAVDEVSFRVDRGMVGILGPNGAGKTTLLRQLAGIIDPTRGMVMLGGVRLPLIRKYLARWVGYLPQDAGLPDRQSPRQYLMYFAALYELPPSIRSERVEGLLTEVGLAGKADENIGALSGGMRQRVAVARTLLRLPDVIIVDEPTAGLDPRERIRFRNLLGTLARTRIVLFSTHVVEDVAIACERVLVMSKGRLVFDGSPMNLAHHAEGKVWEIETPPGEAWTLPPESILASESPMPQGGVVRRVISYISPGAGSRQLLPTPEDGYLWLTERPAHLALT